MRWLASILLLLIGKVYIACSVVFQLLCDSCQRVFHLEIVSLGRENTASQIWLYCHLSATFSLLGSDALFEIRISF